MYGERASVTRSFNVALVVQAERLGELIHRYRKAKGLTQFDLATQARILGFEGDGSAISTIESGKRTLRLPEAAMFQEVLDIPQDEMHRAIVVEYGIHRRDTKRRPRER